MGVLLGPVAVSLTFLSLPAARGSSVPRGHRPSAEDVGDRGGRLQADQHGPSLRHRLPRRQRRGPHPLRHREELGVSWDTPRAGTLSAHWALPASWGGLAGEVGC